MPIARIADADIYYEVHGDGPPLMMVSGLNGTTGWEDQIAEFSRDYRVIVHDQRGCGRSTKSRIAYSMEQMAQDTLQLMDALGIEKAHFVGHSTGGTIGQIVAAQRPGIVDKLVLVSSWLRSDETFRRTMRARQTLLTDSGRLAYTQAGAVFLYPPKWVEDNREALARSEAKSQPDELDDAITASRIDAVVAFDGTPYVDRIRARTCVLVAADDILTPPHLSAELAQRIDQARLEIIDYGAHRVSMVNPVPFNDVLRRFLA